MSATYFFLLTDHGSQRLAAAQAGTQPFQITHLAIGDANNLPYLPQSRVSEMTLVNEQARVPVQSVAVVGGQVEVVATVDSTVGGFNVHEIGLLDEAGQLLYIGNYHGGYKPILTEGAGGDLELVCVLKTSNLTPVVVEMNPTVVIANRQWVLDHFVRIPTFNTHVEQFNTHVDQYNSHVAQNTLEHNNLLALIMAAAEHAGISLEQAVATLSANLLQHRQASNPHPQYLLASTFGVNLLMTATVNTPLDAANRVFGWTGENGDTDFPARSIRWWNRHAETIRFQPFRSYGQFLLHCNFQPQGDGYLEIKTFDQNGVELSLVVLMNISRAAYNVWEPAVKHVFELPANGYAEIHYSMYVWNKHYGAFNGSIFVDDRVKRFTPVGYSSNVDAANTNTTGSTTEASDHSVFPAFEWFYFDTASQNYLQLSAISTLSDPESQAPHFHRNVLLPNANADLWVWVQVGLQTIAEDYAAVETEVLRSGADADGVTIVQIPVSMRTVATPDNETLVYRVAYYASEVFDTELTVPSDSLDGQHQIYVNRL